MPTADLPIRNPSCTFGFFEIRIISVVWTPNPSKRQNRSSFIYIEKKLIMYVASEFFYDPLLEFCPLHSFDELLGT